MSSSSTQSIALSPEPREPAADVSAGLDANSGVGAWLRSASGVVTGAACYYLATRIAWALCFPDSKVSLFFPPHAVLLSILLMVPTRRWWAYVLAAAAAHFIATRQADWPPLYALTCEAFDAVKCVAAAAGVRMLIRSPVNALTLRDAMVFIVVAVVLVPFGAAFWGAAFTVSNRYGTRYWIEWRNLGISNAVTTVVLVPALLLGAYHVFVRRPRAPSPRRVLEALTVVACTVAAGVFVFDHTAAGPDSSPALLYTSIPLLIWAALRFGLGGVSVSMLVVTFLAIWGTMRGHGPFLTQTPAENALALQLFLLVTATPLMLLAVVIEQERRSKEMLREHANLMGIAAEAADLAMWVWNVSHDDVRMTEQGRLLFGFKPDGRVDYAGILDRVHPEDRAAQERAVREAIANQGEYEVEYRVRQADGTVRWIQSRGRCVRSNDDDAAAGPKLFGVLMDVTTRKQAEASAAQEREELRQKQAELAHVARVATLGELTATLAHEISQPLTAILSNSSAARSLLDGPQPDLPEVRAALDDIGNDTERAAEIVRRLRGMLKRDTRGFGRVDVNDLIRAVKRIVQSDALRHGVTVELELPEGGGGAGEFRVNGDEVELQQVLLNLMLNAFGAMDQDAGANGDGARRRLLVRTGAADGGSSVLVEVRDSGIGIAPDKLESIFAPFVTSKPDGLGMGLAISRSIIERHGGRIWADNNADDRGATFSIALPAARA